MATRLESKVEGEGLSVEGKMPPFIRRKEEDANACTFAENEGVSVYEPRSHCRSGGYCYSHLWKMQSAQALKLRHGIGEQKAYRQPWILDI